jgi:peptidoglycan/xylan/chitin deacetylase (PgdA/CDA1 family)
MVVVLRKHRQRTLARTGRIDPTARTFDAPGVSASSGARTGIGAAAAVCLLVAVTQIDRWNAVRAYQTASLPICRVSTNARVVALSFDDGPNARFTPRILAILRRAGTTATFFTVGSRVAVEPDLVRAEAAESMQVANHTWSHPRLGPLDPAALPTELDRTGAALMAAVGSRPTLFRAPFGEIGPGQLLVVRRAGLRAVGWSLAVDPYLDRTDRPDDVAGEIADDVRPGDIILAHDGGADRSATVEMLGPLLADLRLDGYRVVSVGQLLTLGDPIRAAPDGWFWQSGFSCPR